MSFTILFTFLVEALYYCINVFIKFADPNMGKRKGRAVRKNKQVSAGAGGEEPEELSRAPHSFVVHRFVTPSSEIQIPSPVLFTGNG